MIQLYLGLADACKQIWRSEGAYGFYKGLSPALLQVMPQMGLQFGFYSLFTGLWNKSKGTWLYSAPGNDNICSQKDANYCGILFHAKNNCQRKDFETWLEPKVAG